ncbi:MAG: cysteine desulfurase family protein [Bryobacter sp.]|nr:cysteine desulfurase family protein [Bryobacter sp.]
MRAYFDHNATTPLRPEVLDAMVEVYRDTFGNASSIHHYGQTARQRLEAARRQVGTLIGAKAEEIVFTSGGTESNNLAIFGLAPARPGHFVTSTIEHPAVLQVADELERQGHTVTRVPARASGREASGGEASGVVDPADIERALRPETFAVSLMAVNNEIGTVQPVAEVGKLVRERGIFFHCDAVQAPGRVAVDVEAWNVDLLTLSAHKFYGPKGVGALYVRKGVPLRKVSFGGRHERDRRPGTENVPAAVGMGEAAARVKRMSPTLRDWLEEQVLARIPEAYVNGDRERRAPNVSNLRFPGIEGEAIVIGLDLKGVAVSSGAACSSGAVAPSHVLLALGLSAKDARSSIRVSLGEGNTREEVESLVESLESVVMRLRKLSPAYAR